MNEKMLAIQRGKESERKCVPNVLPCRINHNGLVDTSKRYWFPSVSDDGKTVAYFRGRKLYGRAIVVPEGYKGAVLSPADKMSPNENRTQEENENEILKVELIAERSEFEKVMVWGHEVVGDENFDPFIRGLEEWILIADQIHSYSSRDAKRTDAS